MELVRRLVGAWELTGMAGGTALSQKVDGRVVLESNFVELHFQSTEPGEDGDPPYQATYYIGFDEADGVYILHLLDTFGAKYSRCLGTGKRAGNTIEFQFDYGGKPFRNVFKWHPDDGSWTFDLTYEEDGETKEFADKRMVRALRPDSPLVRLMKYDQWATSRVMASLERLSEEQFAREFGGPEASLGQQCFHLLSVCDRYRARLMKKPVPELPAPESRTLAEALRYHKQVREAMVALIEGIDQANLDEVTRHETRRGTFFATFGKTLVHIANHGTYHRGQIACLLKLHGLEPVETDYLLFE